MSTASSILRLALPLVRTHGFSRICLVEAAASLPEGAPLSDTALTALFGRENDARRALISAWLMEGIADIRRSTPADPTTAFHAQLKSTLTRRLEYNKPVLQHLPEAFALLLARGSIPLDPTPAIQHATSIADEALHASGDSSNGTQWYARRGAVALAYSAAELHQMKSPETATGFLERLLDEAHLVETSAGSVTEFAGFAIDGWKGIIRSRAIF